jgi:DNA-binding transcriptional LysR family regulator
MIHPEALKYFLELAKTLHMSRAADRLGVTQPTLSHSLKRLEDQVGQPLFLRSKKGLQLTTAGERLREKAQDLLHSWEAVLTSVQDEVSEVKGRLRLGCHTAVAEYTLPLFLPEFLKEYPEVKLTLQHGLSRHMTEMVVSSQLDVAIAVNPQEHPDLVIKELTRDKVTVWIPKGCANMDLLLVEPHLLQSQDILSKLGKKGLHFARTLESASLEVLAQLMNAGTGCAILPERVVRAFSDVKVQAMKDAPVFEDRICVVYKPEFRKIKRGEVFLRALAKSLH